MKNFLSGDTGEAVVDLVQVYAHIIARLLERLEQGT